MRERERRAARKRQDMEDAYAAACEVVDHVLAHPTLQDRLELSLRFPNLSPEEQWSQFCDFVEDNARICLHGRPNKGILPEFWCHALIEEVDLLAHARPALKRAKELHLEAEVPMPNRLREWTPGPSPPRRRGPRAQAQDMTALRDHVLAFPISAVKYAQEHDCWPERLSLGRALSKGEEPTGYTICGAVCEVVTARHGDYKVYQRVTYHMVRNGWRRYQRKDRTRAGRPILPPQGLAPVLNPPDGAGEPFQRWMSDKTARHNAGVPDTQNVDSGEDGSDTRAAKRKHAHWVSLLHM